MSDPYDRWPDDNTDTLDFLDRSSRQSDIGLRPLQTPTLPAGYDICPMPVDKRYATLDSRDYTKISFGTLLSQDYGRLTTPDTFLGRGIDTTDPQLRGRFTAEEENNRVERGLDYASQLQGPSAARAVKLGLDLGLLMTEREREFCEEFLQCMAALGHDGSESLRIGRVAGSSRPREAAARLVKELSPARWQKTDWNDRLAEDKGERALPASYRRFLGRIAAGEMVDVEPEMMKAYPLQKLNSKTWLYLCEDNKVRAKIDSHILLPPPPPGFTYGPTVSLSTEYGTERGVFAQTVTHELVNKESGEARPFKWITHPGRVLSYPPKQHLADIAGRALTNRTKPAKA